MHSPARQSGHPHPGIAMKLRHVVPGALCALLWSATASAQARFDLDQFDPAPSQSTNAFTVNSARILDGGAFEFGLVLDYANDPLVYGVRGGERIGSIVSTRVGANVMGAIGIADRLEVGIAIPIVIVQQGDDLTNEIGIDGSSASAGLGSVRLVPSVLLFDGDTDASPGGPALAFTLDTRLPTGASSAFQGGDFRIEPELAFDWAFAGGTRISTNVGFLIRPSEADLGETQIGHALTWGLGVVAPIVDTGLHVVAEVQGKVGVTADELQREEIPTEWLLGLRYFVSESFLLQAGGGSGIVNGIGTPDFRVLLGGSYVGGGNPDRDGDGVLKADDVCPAVPEDLDGFEDADGCPDNDNDQDGIADADDACPMQPEDVDGFEDADGCPDPDNDGDGVADRDDACPDEREDADGWDDEDGCPDPDNDGDGFSDIIDGCPDVAEDVDGIVDMDGCPELDADRDSVLDEVDNCPMEPEDVDGFEDEDGCPEEGTGLVTLTCEAIEISETVYFATGSDVIEARSHALLDQVAGVMRQVSYIRRMRVEGHTDSRGADDFNLELSQQRAQAVFDYLVEAGVEPERLVAQGFGETQPIESNDTRAGRAANRRVAFQIVEQDERCAE